MNQQNSQARGFTLIEVLAATAIMSLVILVVLSLTTNVLSVWNKSTGKLDSNYEARVALDLMANDLETLVMRNRDFCWIQVDYASPDHPLSYDGALPKMPEMYFMTRVEDRPRYSNTDADGDGKSDPIYGDICAVTYKVLYQNPLNPNDQTEFPMFGLYRFIVDSQHTFTDVMDTSSGNSTDELKALIAVSGYLDEAGDVASVSDKGIDATIAQSENFLSANVVDLRVVFWYLEPSTGNLVPITTGKTAAGDPIDFTYTDKLYVDGTATPGTLEYVDISVTVMSPEGLAAVQSGSVESDITWHDLVAQYGTTFSRRVQIMAKPL